MSDWFFPSRGYGETEGFSNPGLEMFKGEPIRAMAREICQNSLDAVRDKNKPVRVEFEKKFINPATNFPGIRDMREILIKCRNFWKEQNDTKTLKFINEADREIREGGIFVLRVSDYNTTGLKGAYSKEEITPWKSLVQGNAYSVKSTDNAAGSYGIGKAAPFVVSKLQTVFYRTYDENNDRAAQGVAHLVSFEDENMSRSEEDKVRRSTGYYGDGKENKPFHVIKQLDEINKRDEYGTDLFIPAFAFASGKLEWKEEVIVEILDNFLYSIYSGKLEIKIDNIKLNKESLSTYIDKLMPKTKHAACFYEVIRDDNDKVIEETKKFYEWGKLRLRLLYNPDLNKQILIVRNSGMKIAKIAGLPKGISYTGFLEIKGDKLNAFFREMENPQHNAWEPKRHSDPKLAKKHRVEVEKWVKGMIGQKIKEISGDELDIDVSEYFSERENTEVKDSNYEDQGNQIGHRHPEGKRRRTQATGRKGFSAVDGPDKIYDGMREVYVNARIISKGNGINKMIFTAEDDITEGELEVVTLGENGRSLQLKVKSVNGITVKAEVVDGHIRIKNVKARDKNKLEFKILGDKKYAMGVRAYGN